MKIGGRQSVNNLTHYAGFGGAPRDFSTRHSQPLSFDAVKYRVNGTGRDTYISLDNGGLFHPYHPDFQPLRGTIGFGDKMPGNPIHKPGPNDSYQRRVGYFANGSGRDGYIV